MTYEQWKLKLIELIICESRVRGIRYKIHEIEMVLNDCDYIQGFKDGESPEDVWEGEIDAIADSQ